MLSVKYHRIFDYDLVKSDFPKWLHKSDKNVSGVRNIKSLTRQRREKYSQLKLKIAKKASSVISKIPSVLFIGVTGSLAMMNAKKDSDIDLLIITQKNELWITRLIVYFVFKIMNYKVRSPNADDEKDKLCLNMWLDEGDLVWDKKDRNIYTAHEIAQIIPLINKGRTYERFIYLNRWVLNYWPNAVVVEKIKTSIRDKSYEASSHFFNTLAYDFQKLYMKNKMTKEVVTKTRAIFHPKDWGRIVLSKLSS